MLQGFNTAVAHKSDSCVVNDEILTRKLDTVICN